MDNQNTAPSVKKADGAFVLILVLMDNQNTYSYDNGLITGVS